MGHKARTKDQAASGRQSQINEAKRPYGWDCITLPRDERWSVERSLPEDGPTKSFDMRITNGRFQQLKDGRKRMTLVIEYRDHEES